MARFQVTFIFDRVDVTTAEEALSYAREVASDEMLTVGESTEVVNAEIID